jgi:hypothetical protein
VGDNINGSTPQTLAEHWDGGVWSIVPIPNQGTGSNVLHDVTCITTSNCWAVGAAAGQTLTDNWNGSVWSIVSSPNQSSGGGLNGIACSGSGNCWAVGSYENASNVAQTLTEHWNGKAWSIGSSPVQGTKDNFLYGVSCVVKSGCWAAGDYSNGTVYQTLIERYPGSPAAPTGVNAVPGSTTGSTGPLTVSFIPGASNGSPITGYTARCTSSNGGVAASTPGAASPLTVAGLTTAKTYRCTVKATNAAGTGPASSPSAPVIVGSPTAPTGVKAVPGSTSGTTGPLTVSFTSGANNGSAITSYTASCISSNGGVSGSKSGAASQVTVTGLTTAKTYTCSVRAINARGAGLASAPSPAIAVGAPAAPTGVTAVKVASGTLKISYTAGANNGSAITSYTATCASSNGGVSGSASGTASPFTVGSLTPGDTYTCTVGATNARGTSLPSAPSSAVTA